MGLGDDGSGFRAVGSVVSSLRAMLTRGLSRLDEVGDLLDERLETLDGKLDRAPHVQEAAKTEGRRMRTAIEDAHSALTVKVAVEIKALHELVNSHFNRQRIFGDPGASSSTARPIRGVYARTDLPDPAEFGFDRSPEVHKLLVGGDDIFGGTIHLTDPDDPRSIKLREHVYAWIERTEGRERFFLVEGGVAEPAETERDSLMSDRSEFAWLGWLGREHGIPVAGLEEDQVAQAAALVRDYGRDAVFAYYVMRRQPQVFRAPQQRWPDLRAHFRESAEAYSFLLPEGADPVDEFARVFRRLYPERTEHTRRPFRGYFNSEDDHFLLQETVDVLAGLPALSPVQQVAKACHERRWDHAAKVIQAYRENGIAVCALFGRPHFEEIAWRLSFFDGRATTYDLGTD